MLSSVHAWCLFGVTTALTTALYPFNRWNNQGTKLHKSPVSGRGRILTPGNEPGSPELIGGVE